MVRIDSDDKLPEKHFYPVLKEWDLDKQIKKCEKWLKLNGAKLKHRKWILDIGYSDLERKKVPVCGYTIPISFMKLCIKNNMTLWLSSYGYEFEKQLAKLEQKRHKT